MRKHMQESELRAIAEQHSTHIHIRTMEDGNTHDHKRKATKRQHDILYGILYGALLGLNWGEDIRSSRAAEQAIIDTAEFQSLILMKPYLKDGEEIQSYDSVYIPLQRIVREWEQQT